MPAPARSTLPPSAPGLERDQPPEVCRSASLPAHPGEEETKWRMSSSSVPVWVAPSWPTSLSDELARRQSFRRQQWAHYSFVPSNPWVAVGWRDRKEIDVDLAPVLARRDIALTSRGCEARLSEGNRIELNDGSFVAYDYLVIATGPELAFDEIPGLGPKDNTQSICHIDHAATGEGGLRCARPQARVRSSSAPSRALPASAPPMNSPSSSTPRCARPRCATGCR